MRAWTPFLQRSHFAARHDVRSSTGTYVFSYFISYVLLELERLLYKNQILKNFQLTFIVALTALLVSIFLIGCFPFVIGSVIILFFAGMMSSIYSSMQSTLIYVASKIELRSPTFSLMTMAIGSGSIGALNVAWMGNYFSVSQLVMIMALEGIIFLFIILVIILYLGKNILKTN